MLELSWPWFLVILPLPLLMRFWPQSLNNTQSIWWPNTAIYPQHGQHSVVKNSWKRASVWSLCLGWITLVLAVARPAWIGEVTQVTPSGRDLLIALDLSGSMQVTDMQLDQQAVDRLSAAKHVLSDFIDARQGDRVGLIVFGTKAYLQAPLSYDLRTLNQLMHETQIGFAGEQTAIGDAVGLAIKRLENKATDKKVMILMTDGANTAGRVQPIQAAQFAATQGVKIHTIGIGADEMVVQGFFGPRVINPSTDLDEPLLVNLASVTGGQYFRARSTADLTHIYELIDQLEPTPSEDLWQRPKTSLFPWLGLFALFIISLALALARYEQDRGQSI